MKRLPVLLVVLITAIANAQDPTLITVKAGEDMSALYQQVYRYPEFKPGKIYFIDDSARSLFNYNLLEGKIEFIGEKKDTLWLSDEKSVKQVIIDRDSFYMHDGSYLLSIGDYGFAKLLIKDRIKLMDEKNMGVYGISSSTHTIETKRTLLSLQTQTLQLNKDLVFSRDRNFYYLQKGNYVPATRKNILKLVGPKDKGLVENYMTTQAIDFKNQEHLQRLFQYISSLKK
jgi:hypothetical protein